MTAPQVNVLQLRAFDGPRHDRLRAIWDCLAEHNKGAWRLCRFGNPRARLTHAQGLNAMWAEELKRPERYAIITEEDFLPDWENFVPLGLLTKKRPIFTAEYATRDARTLKVSGHRIPGPWYVLVDKQYIGALNFDCAGVFNDPGNALVEYCRASYGVDLILLTGKDCMPAHYGIKYLPGEHLFWSRHYNDPPELRPAGFDLGDIQRRHDERVTDYLETAPAAFKDLWRARYAPPVSA